MHSPHCWQSVPPFGRFTFPESAVANSSFGLPDLGMTNLNDVCEDVRRVYAATALPLLVDATRLPLSDVVSGPVRNLSQSIK